MTIVNGSHMTLGVGLDGWSLDTHRHDATSAGVNLAPQPFLQSQSSQCMPTATPSVATQLETPI